MTILSQYLYQIHGALIIVKNHFVFISDKIYAYLDNENISNIKVITFYCLLFISYSLQLVHNFLFAKLCLKKYHKLL